MTLLKPLLAAALLVAPVFSVLAGDEDALIQKRDAKLAEGWLKKAAWNTDYDKALAEAKASGKPILAYFTRSYAG